MKILWTLFFFSVSMSVQAIELLELTTADRSFLGKLTIEKVQVDTWNFGNEYAFDIDAAKFGKSLFFDTRLSSNGQVSCATCHVPELYFTDGKPLAFGVGPVKRNTPTVLLAKHSPWQFWDGRKDSLWSQALGPLTDSNEHGLSFEGVVALVRQNHSDAYQSVFGPFTDDEDIFANVGKAIMAYEMMLSIEPSRFDTFASYVAKGEDEKAAATFSQSEFDGMKVFLGKGNCVSCHNGPLFTNFEFHNVGVPERDQSEVDLGRFLGVKKLEADGFNCLSDQSSAKDADCEEITYLKTSGPELVGAFKTPSLRNVEKTAPYMHSGQFATLEEVVEHYNKPKPPFYDRKQHPSRPHFDILPLRLTDYEKESLVSFLKTLTSPLPKDDFWWPVSAQAH